MLFIYAVSKRDARLLVNWWNGNDAHHRYERKFTGYYKRAGYSVFREAIK